MKLKEKNQDKRIIKREKSYATEAYHEGDYMMKDYHKNMRLHRFIQAKDDLKQAKIDKYWGDRRMAKVHKIEKKLGLKHFLFLLFSIVLAVSLVSFVGAVGFAPNVTNQVIFYAPLHNNSIYGENETLAVDISGFGHNGTIFNATINNTGSIFGNGAVVFSNESNSRIYFQNVLSIGANDAWTICTWVKFNSLNGAQFILAKYPGGLPEYDLYKDIDHKFKFIVRNASVQTVVDSNFVPKVNQLYWLCAQTNQTNGNQTIYVNSIPRISVIGTSGAINPTGSSVTNFTLGGRRPFVDNTTLNGSLSEVIIWNYTLSNRELYNTYRDYLQYMKLENNLTIYSDTTLDNSQVQNMNLTSFHDLSTIVKVLDNITLDCNNTIINGAWSTYFDFGRVFEILGANTTIKNCKFNNYYLPILTHFNNTKLFNNIYENISFTSFYLNSSNNMVYNETILDMNSLAWGLTIGYLGKYNNVSNIYMRNISWDGLQIKGSYNNISNIYIQDTQHHALDMLCLESDETVCAGNIFNNIEVNRTIGLILPSNPFSNYVYIYRGQNNTFINSRFYGGSGVSGYGIGLAGNLTAWDFAWGNSFINITVDNVTKWGIVESLAVANTTFINIRFSNLTQGFFSGEQNAHNNTFLNSLIEGELLDLNLYNQYQGYINISNQYYYLKNINLSYQSNISIFNQTKSLIYLSNYSVLCANIDSCSGNFNITLDYLNYSYILPNYNITEGISRDFSPIWFSSSSSTSKHIASNLSDTINADVIINVDCSAISSIKYTSNTGAYSQTFTRGNFPCSNGQATLSITGIEPASASNVLDLTYGCGNGVSGILVALQIFIALGCVLFIIALFVMSRNGMVEVDLKIMLLGFTAGMIAIIMLGSLMNITGGLCGG